jgi:hypothetical protein
MQAGVAALVLCAFSAGAVWQWEWVAAGLAAGLFLGVACVLLCFGLRPAIELDQTHLKVGKRRIPWTDIRRVDRTGWLSPLLIHLTLFDDSRLLVVYPGDLDSANSLLRNVRRGAREALIDGVPYRQFWGQPGAGRSDPKPLPSPRYRLLRPEDEAEVERLYQKLKSVRRLDSDSSADES